MKICARCGGPYLDQLQHPITQALGLFGAALTPDGPGRTVVEAVKHASTCAQRYGICTKCSGVVFQPAWLPLSPAVERAEALVAGRR